MKTVQAALIINVYPYTDSTFFWILFCGWLQKVWKKSCRKYAKKVKKSWLENFFMHNPVSLLIYEWKTVFLIFWNSFMFSNLCWHTDSIINWLLVVCSGAIKMNQRLTILPGLGTGIVPSNTSPIKRVNVWKERNILLPDTSSFVNFPST